MKLSENEENILRYLKSHVDYISPTQIGHDVGGKVIGYYGPYFRHSAWASPICKRLVKKGLVERSEKGWYKAV